MPRFARGICQCFGSLAALNGQEAVAGVFVNAKAGRKVGCFRALIFAEVVDALLFATAQGNQF